MKKYYTEEKIIRAIKENQAKRPRELEAENNKLKKLLAEKLLEKQALKDVVSKKW